MRVTLLLAVASAAGCTTTGQGPGGAGSAAGTAVTGASGGVMVGGLVTGRMAEGLGRGDIRKALEAEHRALEYAVSGQSVTWTGSFGRSGDVTPAQPYRVGSQDCRQYTHRLVVDGATRTARGTACRNADGSWTTLT